MWISIKKLGPNSEFVILIHYLSHDLEVGELYVIYSHVHDWIRASYNIICKYEVF